MRPLSIRCCRACRGRLREGALFALALPALLAPLLLSPSAAAATGAEVEAGNKGLVGGTLLGAEVVDLGLAIGGVHASWPYWALGAVGAAGGGWLGYTLDQTASPTASMYMLAGGVALVIPTVIVTLDATAYRPPEAGHTAPAALLALEPSPPGRGAVPGSLQLGLPLPEVRPVYSAQERATYGLPQRAELRLPLLSGSF